MHLFRILKNLKDEGKTIILITHKLREIMAVTDSVSVMRRGEMTATKPTAETNAQELAELMVGRQVLLNVEKGVANPGAPLLSVENLNVKDDQGVQKLASQASPETASPNFWRSSQASPRRIQAACSLKVM